MRDYTDVDPKAIAMAQDTLDAEAGPRYPNCGGCDMNLAPKWAGVHYGWCECDEETEDDGITLTLTLGGYYDA